MHGAREQRLRLPRQPRLAAQAGVLHQCVSKVGPGQRILLTPQGCLVCASRLLQQRQCGRHIAPGSHLCTGAESVARTHQCVRPGLPCLQHLAKGGHSGVQQRHCLRIGLPHHVG